MSKRVEFFPAGTTFDDVPLVLHDEKWLPFRVLADVTGMEAPLFSFESISTPGVDGVSFGSVTASRPEMVLPVFVKAETRVQLRELKSQMAVALNPKLGSGRLVVTEDHGLESGESRVVDAIYRGGLEGDGASGGIGTWWRFSLKFECPDPFWYSTDPAVARWVGKQGRPFFPFKFPFRLSPYGLNIDTPLDLAGDVESWGTYTLSGPWSRVRFSRLTRDRFGTLVATGESWEVRRDSGDLTGLVVQTKTGRVRTDAGANAYGWLTLRDFFPLLPGDAVSAEADGATADTVIELSVPQAWHMGT